MSPSEWETLRRAELQWRAKGFAYRELHDRPDFIDKAIRYLVSVFAALAGER